MHLIQWFLLLSLALTASAVDEADQSQPTSLTELAGGADLVALAQVRDTDYLRRRGIPVSGSAFLQVLIGYKNAPVGELIEVYENGLRDRECYFPGPDVFEEGRRYLLFLMQDPDRPDRFRGLPPGCAIDVLVRTDNRYAVRLPVTGFDLSDALSDHAEEMAFGDAYAVVRDEELPPALRDAMLAAGQIAPHHPAGQAFSPDASTPPTFRHWRYTTGVDLGMVRRLMQAESLTD
jgi:hypothetical protein